MADVWVNSMACHPRVTCHIAGCCHPANSVSWYQSYMSHYRVLPPGKFNGMSSQSHESHCRVLPLGEFTVMILNPHATLQGAVTWQNQYHDHATLQGVIIPSAILKIVFRHILFFVLFLMQFGLWRAAAFVSSLIHLYRYRQVLGVCQDFSARWCTGGAGRGTGFTQDFCISVVYLKKVWTDFDEDY